MLVSSRASVLSQRQGLPLQTRSPIVHTRSSHVRRAGPVRVSCSSAAASWQQSAFAAVQQQPVFQLAASVIGACQQFVHIAREKFSQAFPQLQNVDKKVRSCLIIGVQSQCVSETAISCMQVVHSSCVAAATVTHALVFLPDVNYPKRLLH